MMALQLITFLWFVVCYKSNGLLSIQTGYVGDGTPDSVPHAGIVSFPTPFSTIPLVFLTPHEPDSDGATSCRVVIVTTTDFSYECFTGPVDYPTNGLMWMAIEQ